MDSPARRVKTCRPPAPYVGGKRNLARHIARRIEEVAHDLYAEPFVGMGGVFLARRSAPEIEIVNDRSRDVANLFRILQRHYDAFMQMLRFQLTSRIDFDRLNSVRSDMLTDLERAARFLYLQRTAFGGKVAGRTFGVSLTAAARFDVDKLAEVLRAVHERIAGVTVENLDFADFIARYDARHTLFYIDPPYFGSEHYYGIDLFTRADFLRLARHLEALAGSFILSINDTSETRAIFAPFDIECVEVTYSLPVDGAKRSPELIVSRVRDRCEARLF